MLPWIFVVLVLLNAGLYYWGHQREKALEPPATPVPEGSYEMRLLGEIKESPEGAAEDAGDPVAEGLSAESESTMPEQEAPDAVPAGTAQVQTSNFEVTRDKPVAAEAPQSEPAGEDVRGQPDAGSSEQDSGGLSPDEMEAEGPAAQAEDDSITPPPGSPQTE